MNAQLADLLRYFYQLEQQPDNPFPQMQGMMDVAQSMPTLRGLREAGELGNDKPEPKVSTGYGGVYDRQKMYEESPYREEDGRIVPLDTYRKSPLHIQRRLDSLLQENLRTGKVALPK